MLTEGDVREFLGAWETASNGRDYSKVSALIHPDAVIRFTDGDFASPETIREAIEGTWGIEVENERYYMANVRILTLDQASASLTFDFHWTGVFKGKEFHTAGRGTSVIVQSATGLQLIHEHLSHFPGNN